MNFRMCRASTAAALFAFAVAGIAASLSMGAASAAEIEGYTKFDIKPSETDARISAWDTPSKVFYDPAVQDDKILLWLAGTGGTPKNVPAGLFRTALKQGYRVISLSFISEPAVAQLCTASVLEKHPRCAAQFRQMRIYGDNGFSAIPDEPQDAIVNRLTKLLQYLDHSDPNGRWAQYLQDGAIRWNRIAIAGQSQGGGMAEYLGQHEVVDRVLSFSGGWDFAPSGSVAGWYFEKNKTAADRWYGTYHVQEQFAKALADSYRALKIPVDHVFALDQPLQEGRQYQSPNPYHGQGMSNPVYQPVWAAMLGSGLGDAVAGNAQEQKSQ